VEGLHTAIPELLEYDGGRTKEVFVANVGRVKGFDGGRDDIDRVDGRIHVRRGFGILLFGAFDYVNAPRKDHAKSVVCHSYALWPGAKGQREHREAHQD
jgi:hypothetical protein